MVWSVLPLVIFFFDLGWGVDMQFDSNANMQSDAISDFIVSPYFDLAGEGGSFTLGYSHYFFLSDLDYFSLEGEWLFKSALSERDVLLADFECFSRYNVNDDYEGYRNIYGDLEFGLKLYPLDVLLLRLWAGADIVWYLSSDWSNAERPTIVQTKSHHSITPVSILKTPPIQPYLCLHYSKGRNIPL